MSTVPAAAPSSSAADGAERRSAASAQATRATLFVTTGPGLDTAPHGDLLALDWERKEVVDHLRCPLSIHEKSHKGLAGASWSGGRLWASNEGEVLEIDLHPLRIVRRITHPSFNDVHHVAAADGRLWVCNSGLDSIEELDLSGRWLACHELVRPFGRGFGHVGELLWNDFVKSWKRMSGRFKQYAHLDHRPPFRNLRKLVAYHSFRASRPDWRRSDLRPHVLHPNHLLPVDGDLWVTLWRTGEVVSLRSKKVLARGLGRPHDGVLCGEDYYVTDCESNRLLVFAREGASKLALRQEKHMTEDVMEGFLRGVWADGERLFVAFTARRGAAPQHRRGRIVELDRRTLAVQDEWTVPAEFGNGVFSLLPAAPQGAK